MNDDTRDMQLKIEAGLTAGQYVNAGEPEIYEKVVAEVEEGMLIVIMSCVEHNQTKAAQVLGLNRGTLRKKLKKYGML